MSECRPTFSLKNMIQEKLGSVHSDKIGNLLTFVHSWRLFWSWVWPGPYTKMGLNRRLRFIERFAHKNHSTETKVKDDTRFNLFLFKDICCEFNVPISLSCSSSLFLKNNTKSYRCRTWNVWAPSGRTFISLCDQAKSRKYGPLVQILNVSALPVWIILLV